MTLPKPVPALAIDIGGTKIAGAIVMPDGQVVQLRQLPTPAQAGGEAVLGQVISLAQSLGRASAKLKPAAIGIGTAGFIQPETGVVAFATSALPGWQGMPISQRVEQALGLPTFVDNDVHVMALGEALFGTGRGYRHIIGLTVGTGIGGGIVIDGRIYRGGRGSAGAAGHLIIDYQEHRRCPCGRYGCLEAYAAGPVMVADFVTSVGYSHIQDEFGLDPDHLGVQDIADLARANRPAALATIERGATFLGIGIATLLNMLNPEVVIVGGGVAQIGEAYFAPIRRVVQERALPNVALTPILPAQLGPQANLVGAACLAWQGLESGTHHQ
jgi:glucokinase